MPSWSLTDTYDIDGFTFSGTDSGAAANEASSSSSLSPALVGLQRNATTLEVWDHDYASGDDLLVAWWDDAARSIRMRWGVIVGSINVNRPDEFTISDAADAGGDPLPGSGATIWTSRAARTTFAGGISTSSIKALALSLDSFGVFRFRDSTDSPLLVKDLRTVTGAGFVWTVNQQEPNPFAAGTIDHVLVHNGHPAIANTQTVEVLYG